MTFPRVSQRGRDFANMGDVIIYPELVVARTGGYLLKNTIDTERKNTDCIKNIYLYSFLDDHTPNIVKAPGRYSLTSYVPSFLPSILTFILPSFHPSFNSFLLSCLLTFEKPTSTE